MDNIDKIYDFICDYVKDKSPTIIHGADYNIRHEIIGSPPRSHATSNTRHKYIDGDKIIDYLYKKGINVVNIPNQITFSRTINGKIQEAIMDIIMTNITNDTCTQYHNTFINSIQCSDHYPNYAELMGHTLSITEDCVIKTIQWKLENIKKENIKEYQNQLSSAADTILSMVKNDTSQRQKYQIQYIEALTDTTLTIIEDAGKTHFGTKIVTNYDKPYITTAILEYINMVRYYKKKYRSIWRTVRNIRRNTMNQNNVNVHNTNYIQDRIKLILGSQQYKIWQEIIAMDKNKTTMIRVAKRKYYNEKAKQTLTKTRTKHVMYINGVYITTRSS